MLATRSSVCGQSFSFFCSAALVLATAHFALATNRTVTNLNDTGAGSLRAMIAASVNNDTIDFSVTGTITLTSAELVIGRSIAINGPGANTLTVARSSAGGTPSFRIFRISNGTTSGPTVAISGMTIRNGDVTGTLANEVGAGIYNDHGNLSLTNCVISGNNAPDIGGGGIYNFGNTAGSAMLTMLNCTVSGNNASGFAQGGGIFSVGNSGGSAAFSLTNCTFSQNSGYNGGAIATQGAGSSTATNCTFNGNTMQNDGGAFIIYGGAGVALSNCTISNNGRTSSGNGGGVWGGCTLRNTIVAGNTAQNGPDVNDAGAPFISLGHNLIGKTDTSTGWVASDLTGTILSPLDPLFYPLEDNGGPTQTMALQATSAAINAGDAVAPVGDQRHYVRAGAVDIGAFEFGGAIARAVSRKTHGGVGDFDVALPLSAAVTTVAGLAGTSGSAEGAGSVSRFNFPTDAAVDSSGNIYVADFGSHTIRKIDPAGTVSTLAGLAANPGTTNGTGSVARFTNPHGVVVDSAGNVYVADYGNHAIRKITPVGAVTTFAGLPGTPGITNATGGAARFNNPAGIAIDTADNIYVADSSNHTIRKITPGAVVTTFAGSAGNPGSADGTGGAARFSNPFDVIVDSTGGFYVADFGNATIRQISAAAVVSTLAGAVAVAGSNDGLNAVARFNGPTSVSVDGSGRVYVADFNNHTIRRISGGVVRTIAGLASSAGTASGTGGIARFNGPGSVTIDSTGKILVADTNNHTIRSLQTSSSGNECRSGGPSSDHRVVLTFANPVSVAAASVTLDPAVTGPTGNASSFLVNGAEVTVNLGNVSNAQTILATISGVNDGTNIGTVSLPVSFLLGDTTSDSSVNSGDISQTKSKSGQAVDATNFRTDLNVDGSINSADISLVKSRSGTGLASQMSVERTENR